MTSPSTDSIFTASTTSKNAELSPAQANFVYWLNGLAPIATCIVTPLVTAWSLRAKHNLTPLQKYNQQVNEVVRQLVSGTIGLVSYFGGGEFTHTLLEWMGKSSSQNKKQPMSEASKQVLMIIGGTVVAFLGYAFARPAINTAIISRFLKEESGVNKIKLTPAPQSWLSPIQNWIDKTLLPDGSPKLGKTAWVASGILTSYLGTLTAAVAGLKHWGNDVFKSKQENQPSKTAPNIAFNTLNTHTSQLILINRNPAVYFAQGNNSISPYPSTSPPAYRSSTVLYPPPLRPF